MYEEAAQHPGEQEAAPQTGREEPTDQEDGQEGQAHEEGAVAVDGQVLKVWNRRCVLNKKCGVRCGRRGDWGIQRTEAIGGVVQPLGGAASPVFQSQSWNTLILSTI